MKKLSVIIVLVLALIAATGTYVYAVSSRPTIEEIRDMTPEQIRQIEPAYGGSTFMPEQQHTIDPAALELVCIAPQDREAVRDLIARGKQPKLRERKDGLLELDR